MIVFLVLIFVALFMCCFVVSYLLFKQDAEHVAKMNHELDQYWSSKVRS